MDDFEFPVLKLFRRKMGDLAIADVPFPRQNFPGLDNEDTERAAMGILESYFRDATRRSDEKPTQAVLVEVDDAVISEFRMTDEGARRVMRGKPNANGS